MNNIETPSEVRSTKLNLRSLVSEVKCVWTGAYGVFFVMALLMAFFQFVVDQGHIAQGPHAPIFFKVASFFLALLLFYVYDLLLWSLIATESSFSLIAKAEKSERRRFILRKFPALFVEVLRADIVVLIHLLLLIVPGLYKMARFTFVPLVVLMDSRYEVDDEYDPLKVSYSLTKKIWGLFLALHVVLLGLSFFDEFYVKKWLLNLPFWMSGLLTFLSCLLHLFLLVLVRTFFLRVYIKAR